jgi:hypothetical protein
VSRERDRKGGGDGDEHPDEHPDEIFARKILNRKRKGSGGGAQGVGTLEVGFHADDFGGGKRCIILDVIRVKSEIK